jgi:hypothetical protein
MINYLSGVQPPLKARILLANPAISGKIGVKIEQEETQRDRRKITPPAVLVVI